MHTLDLSVELASPDGKEIMVNDQVMNLGKAISTILLNTSGPQAMKMFLLATEFYKAGKSTKIDQVDYQLIVDTVSACQQYPVMLTGQVLTLLHQQVAK